MIGLIFSPLGRYIILGGLLTLIIAGAYAKIKSEAVVNVRAQATADALKRVQDAITAGDAAAVNSDRLLEDDGHRRD